MAIYYGGMMSTKFDLYGLAKINGISAIEFISGDAGGELEFEVVGTKEASREAHSQIMMGATSARLHGVQISLSGIRSTQLSDRYRYIATSRLL